MPVVEVEMRDDGTFGTLPESLQQFVNRKIDEAHKKGAEKKADALSPYLVDPSEVERLRTRDRLLAEVEAKEAERAKEYEKAAKIKEESLAREKEQAVKAEQAKTKAAIDKVRASAGKTIRAVAAAAGARAESLDELERLLGVFVDLDENLEHVVLDAADPKKRRVDDKGEQVSIEGMVQHYLSTHPHHLKAMPAAGGRAPGGATFAGVRQPTDDRSRAFAEMEADPSIENVARAFGAIRRTAS
jgi:hypothetical protein